jgi:predicted nucleic acid-binding Zn ribbon protein
MRIEKKVTYYGYDLVINHILHKKCLSCRKWYEFDGEKGYCDSCMEIVINNKKRKQIY